MKKLSFFIAVLAMTSGLYAQDAAAPLFQKKGTNGGGFMKKEATSSEVTQSYIKKGGTGNASNVGTNENDNHKVVEDATPDCQTNHTGEVLFFNKEGRPISLTFQDTNNGEEVTIKLAKDESSFINNLAIGEYKYKETKNKKYKKDDKVVIRECIMKIVEVD